MEPLCFFATFDSIEYGHFSALDHKKTAPCRPPHQNRFTPRSAASHLRQRRLQPTARERQKSHIVLNYDKKLRDCCLFYYLCPKLCARVTL